MDGRLLREVLGFIEGVAVREKERLGTFVEIEDLPAEIGDEVTLLSVLETCRQQDRDVFAFIRRSVEHHLTHQKTPSLLTRRLR